MDPSDPDAIADAPDIDLDVGDSPAHATIGRGKLALIVAPIVVLWLMNLAGNPFGAATIRNSGVWFDPYNELVLMGLSPANRNVALAAGPVLSGSVPFILFFLVGFIRLLAPDASFYALGYFYGERAISWLERRTGSLGKSLRWFEGVFPQFGSALVVIMPNNPVCLLAGASTMRLRWFVTLNLVGTAGRMLILYKFGDLFSTPISWLTEQLAKYRPFVFAVSIGGVIVLLITEFRKGTSGVEAITQVPEDHEPEEEPL